MALISPNRLHSFNNAVVVFLDKPIAFAIWLLLHWTVSVLLRQIAFNNSRNPAILAG
nr:MAG TPA: hypothetical protein [Caudoviricetes sp.]